MQAIRCGCIPAFLSLSPDSNTYRPRHFVPIIAFRLLTTHLLKYDLTSSILDQSPTDLQDLNSLQASLIRPLPHNNTSILLTSDLTTSPPHILTTATMFLKQTAYKPRSGSQSSQGGQAAENKSSSASPPPKAEATPRKSTDVVPGAISAAAAGRRRVSLACPFLQPSLSYLTR